MSFPVSTKAIQGAKNIKSFLFSAVNKAGKTVSEAGAKIKKTVEENVRSFNMFEFDPDLSNLAQRVFYVVVCIYSWVQYLKLVQSCPEIALNK